MASSVNAALCALLATAFYSWLGYGAGRQILPRVLAFAAAPVLGWAIFSAVSLPVFVLTGLSAVAVATFAGLCALAAGVAMAVTPASREASTPLVSGFALAAAAALALVPAVAILPKFAGDSVYLADPIFDHSKIAIVDAMIREGLPPINPVFGETGTASHLAYYYLWHFAAASLALPLGIGGWEADIGLTWFTAFASLALMMGLAVWLSGRSSAALLVVILAAAGSVRVTLCQIFGLDGLEPFLQHPTGFAGWLFQSAWVPQHLMSASSAVMAMLLLAQFARHRGPGLLLALVATVVAGYESSTYVGGVTFAIAVLPAAPIVLLSIDPAKRARVVVGLLFAAALALTFVMPFIRDQIALVAVHGGTPPVGIHPFEVLGELVPLPFRRVLDLPAYWLVLLPIEFPATFFAGSIALFVLLRSEAPPTQKTTTALIAALAMTGLVCSWLLVGTLGDNNDLALRAVLPATMVLIVAAAAGLASIPCRPIIVATALGGLVLSLPDTANLIHSNFGAPKPDGAVFARSPELWAAVRRRAGPDARVANNPLFLSDLLPWPVNISWALLSNRDSCFAGRETALAFAPLPAERREAINRQFIRVFDGGAMPGDVDELALRYGCDVVVLVAQDGAWTNDPFASNPHYRLTESRDGKWRIYVSASH